MQELLMVSGKKESSADKTLMLLSADSFDGTYPIDKAKPGRKFTKYLTPAGQANAQVKFGDFSLDCRNGGYHIAPDQKTDLVFPAQAPFTIEFWAYNPVVDGNTWWMWFNTGTQSCLKTFQTLAYLQDNTNSFIIGNLASIPVNRWNHLAIVYNGNSMAFYVNGSRLIGQLSQGGWSTAGAFARIMGGEANAKCFMDQFRVSKVARYTGASFSVPTEPFVLD